MCLFSIKVLGIYFEKLGDDCMNNVIKTLWYGLVGIMEVGAVLVADRLIHNRLQAKALLLKQREGDVFPTVL